MSDKFESTLYRIEREIPKLQEECRFIRHFYTTGNKEQAYSEAFQLAAIAEKMALLTRTLPCYTGNPKAHRDIEECIEKSVPVEIFFTREGWFSLRIPK